MATKHWISTSSTSFTTAANWSDGNAPANSDVLVFNHLGTASCTTDLGTALTGLVIYVEKTYTGNIGVLSGSTATYLVIDGGTLHLQQNTGQGGPSGSPLIMINTGSTAAVANVYDSSSTSSSSYYPPIILKGTSLTVNQFGGSMAVAPLPGETATLTALKITKGVSPQVAASTYLGAGVTTTLMTASTGTIINRAGQTQTAVTLSGDARYTYDGTGAHTTLSVNKGAVATYAGTGTITTLNLFGGTFDREKDTRALTITNTNLYDGCSILLNNGVASSTTRTNAVAFVGCAIQNVSATMPAGERL